MDKTIKLPGDVIRSIESGQRMKDQRIINNPDEDVVGSIITRELGLRGCSFIALRLYIEGRRLGVIDFFASDKNRFNETHLHLLSLLREPFAIAMANALQHQDLVQLKEELLSDNRYLNNALISRSGDEVIGEEQGLKEVTDKVEQIAHLKNTVLLLGETGVGKEVIANAIHRKSPRHREPFIKVNCGAIPEQLIDSELFGHEKGAFTGALTQKRGLFERANKGTIFLDEIGELPPWAQIRLLRVLQTQEIERVGGSPPIQLDIRVIAATHRDLAKMVAEGSFREDLWFRINAFPIQIPSLRHRIQDIPLLVDFFIRKKSEELGIHKFPQITKETMRELVNHEWPGNVRELENVVERALIQHRQGPLSFDGVTETRPANGPSIPVEKTTTPASLDEIIKKHILDVLYLTKGRISGPQGAAAVLKMHHNTLRNRMERMGIEFSGRKR